MPSRLSNIIIRNLLPQREVSRMNSACLGWVPEDQNFWLHRRLRAIHRLWKIETSSRFPNQAASCSVQWSESRFRRPGRARRRTYLFAQARSCVKNFYLTWSWTAVVMYLYCISIVKKSISIFRSISRVIRLISGTGYSRKGHSPQINDSRRNPTDRLLYVQEDSFIHRIFDFSGFPEQSPRHPPSFKSGLKYVSSAR